MLTTYRKIMVWSLWPLLFLLDLNQDWKKEKNKSCWSQVVTMPVYFGCVLRGFVPNWSSKTQTPSFCSHTESSCHKKHLTPKIRDESNPNGLDLLNFLTPTPHQPSGYHYQSPQVYHHHVCCWQLSLAWFLLEENIGVMEVGMWGKKNLHRDNIWVFVGKLGNSNPPIKSASNVKVASVSLFTKISWSWLRFQPLDSITWLWLKIFCSQWLDDWEWSIKSVVPKTSALLNFEATGILLITRVYKSTMKFWKTRDADGTGQLSSLVVCRCHLQPPFVECRGSKTIAHVWKWKSLTN